MKIKSILLLSTLISLLNFNFSQNKYPSLLWEISKEGQSKKSYLYGTMHVSGRVAYNLGVDFFNALESVDVIALESNPILWLDMFENNRNSFNEKNSYYSNYNSRGFYRKQFTIKPLQYDDFSFFLKGEHYYTNWLLMRSQDQDYEEDTFLDMFIYRIAKKKGKPVHSLEDFELSNYYANKSNMRDEIPKKESKWFNELTEDINYYQLVENSYRDQNLDMLDSLNYEVSSDSNIKYMLVERNKIMVDSLTHIIGNGKSIFGAIGAAHLPGENGVVELLRKEGYTLKPIELKNVEEARLIKDELAKKKTPMNYNVLYDGNLFDISLPNKLYWTYSKFKYNNLYFSPELNNGSYFVVNEMSKYDYIFGNENKNYINYLDSMLYENIAGEIISKENIKIDGQDAFRVINKLKNGDYQENIIVDNPLNITIFKSAGKYDQVLDESSKFQNAIKLKKLNDNWTKFTSHNNRFSIEIPDFYIVKNNKNDLNYYSNLELESYEKSNDVYYLLKSYNLSDLNYIEEDDFELKRIIEMFVDEHEFKDLKFDSKNKNGQKFCVAKAKTKSNKSVKIKSVMNGNEYYLLIAVSSNVKKINDKFFNSITFEKYTYKMDEIVIADTVNNFKVKGKFVSPQKLFFEFRDTYAKFNKKKQTTDNNYQFDENEIFFTSENDENISLNIYKFNDYAYIENIDSLIKNVEKIEQKRKFIISKSEKLTNNNYPSFFIQLQDTGSNKIINHTYILNKNRLYQISYSFDNQNKIPDYYTEFINNFDPSLNDKIEFDLFNKKNKLFFTNIEKDSLSRINAFKSLEIGLYQYMKEFKLNKIKENKNGNSDEEVVDEEVVDEEEVVEESFYYSNSIGKNLTYNKIFNSKITFDSIDNSHIIKIINTLKADEKNRLENLYDLLGLYSDNTTNEFLIKKYNESMDSSYYQSMILSSLSFIPTKEKNDIIISLLEKDFPISNIGFISNMLDSTNLYNEFLPKLEKYQFIDEYNDNFKYILMNKLFSDSVGKHKELFEKNKEKIINEFKLEYKRHSVREQEAENSNFDKDRYDKSDDELAKITYKDLFNYIQLLYPYRNEDKRINEIMEKCKNFKSKKFQLVYYGFLKSKGENISTEIYKNILKSKEVLSLINSQGYSNYAFGEEMRDIKKFKKYIPTGNLTQKEIAELILKDKIYKFDPKEDSLIFVKRTEYSSSKSKGRLYFFKMKQKKDDYWSLAFIGNFDLDDKNIFIEKIVFEDNIEIPEGKDEIEYIDEYTNHVKLKDFERAVQKFKGVHKYNNY